MTKLSYTLGMKVFACFIAVLSAIRTKRPPPSREMRLK